MEKIEYRVRPVTRFIVTRYEADSVGVSSTGVREQGEYDNAQVAYEVGYALAKAEADRLRLPPGDKRMTYPRMEDAFPDQQKQMSMAAAAGFNLNEAIEAQLPT